MLSRGVSTLNRKPASEICVWNVCTGIQETLALKRPWRSRDLRNRSYSGAPSKMSGNVGRRSKRHRLDAKKPSVIS